MAILLQCDLPLSLANLVGEKKICKCLKLQVKRRTYLYPPRAFMYSSKFWLSVSFQVAQNASTILALSR